MARRQSVSAERFIAGYLQAHKQGWTVGQLADYLGMEKNSANVKASQIRGDLESRGIELPKLKQIRAKKDLGILAKMVTDYEASLSDLDGNKNVTISDHMGTDVPNETEFVSPPDEGNDGRTLIGSM